MVGCTVLILAVLFVASVFLQIAVPQRRFCADEIPDLTGKTAVISGANTGLGLETAAMLATAGARVVMACRSMKRCEGARSKILARGALQGSLECWEMDLSSLASVSAFGKKFAAQGGGVDILVNNAGVMGAYGYSKDGFEMHFGVNHLGHYLLTKVLMPSIMQRPTARVVSVSSLAHLFTYPGTPLDLASLRDLSGYVAGPSYGQSKLANILFANALARRLAGTAVYVNSLHPGAVATELTRDLKHRFGAWIDWVLPYVHNVMMDPHSGALTQTYLAASPEVEEQDIRGRYFVPIALPATPSWHATNVTLQEELWALSEAYLIEHGYGNLTWPWEQ